MSAFHTNFSITTAESLIFQQISAYLSYCSFVTNSRGPVLLHSYLMFSDYMLIPSDSQPAIALPSLAHSGFVTTSPIFYSSARARPACEGPSRSPLQSATRTEPAQERLRVYLVQSVCSNTMRNKCAAQKQIPTFVWSSQRSPWWAANAKVQGSQLVVSRFRVSLDAPSRRRLLAVPGVSGRLGSGASAL